ncbi:hypothetical protein [Faecalimicrobium sp. JNUCC 81]
MINGYKIWDKESSINGADAEFVMQSDTKFRDMVTLFLLKDNKPVRHMFFEIEPTEEECQAILSEIQKEQQVEEDKRLSLEEAEKKISILSEQNAKLLLDSAIKTNEISALNKNAANLTLEIAKMKGGM